MSAKPDMQRLVGDILRPGLIASVDHAAKRCTVTIGDMTTGPLPWIALRAGRARIWSPPSVGEQCLLLCAEGDTHAGFVLPGLFCDAFPAPSSSPDIVSVAFDGGGSISYDMASSALTIEAAGGVTINGDVTVTGTLTASEDVLGDGKSLKGHMHSCVQPGGGQSGAPV